MGSYTSFQCQWGVFSDAKHKSLPEPLQGLPRTAAQGVRLAMPDVPVLVKPVDGLLERRCDRGLG